MKRNEVSWIENLSFYLCGKFQKSCRNRFCDIKLHNPCNLGQLRNSPPTGPLRVAELPGEANPVIFSVHDEIARHYGVDEKNLPESHAATIDYVVAAAGG